MEILVFLSILTAALAVLSSWYRIRRVKEQIAEIADALADVKNGNGGRRILSAANELAAPIAYEINEIVVSYERRLSAVRQTEEANRQLMTSLSHDVRTPLQHSSDILTPPTKDLLRAGTGMNISKRPAGRPTI